MRRWRELRAIVVTSAVYVAPVDEDGARGHRSPVISESDRRTVDTTTMLVSSAKCRTPHASE